MAEYRNVMDMRHLFMSFILLIVSSSLHTYLMLSSALILFKSEASCRSYLLFMLHSVTPCK